MTSNISQFLLDQICILKVLCNPKTLKAFVLKILRAASAVLVKAISELLLNIREKFPKLVKNIIIAKKVSLKNKRQAIIKYWKLIRGKISPLVDQVHDAVSKTRTTAGDTRADDHAQTGQPNK